MSPRSARTRTLIPSSSEDINDKCVKSHQHSVHTYTSSGLVEETARFSPTEGEGSKTRSSIAIKLNISQELEETASPI
eukprot:g52371.t1